MRLPDQMMDPLTGQLLPVNPLLLSQLAWRDAPTAVDSILQQLARGSEHPNLSTLARAFLEPATPPVALPSSVPRTGLSGILVLGNALNKDATATPELLRRLAMALLAHTENKAALIITSGDGETLGVTEAALMKNWLISEGVSPAQVISETHSNDTVQNLTFSTEILLQERLDAVTLITGPCHITRAYLLLVAYLAHRNIPITATPGVCHSAVMWDPLERFLYFKDLGRILGLWEYQSNKLG